LIPSIVVDTDVLSFIFKEDTMADLYAPHLKDKVVVVCFMTVAELRQWALIKQWGPTKRQRLESFLQNYIIFHSDDDFCTKWAEATRSAVRNGRPIDSADAWVAATSLLHSIPLVTHNQRHYTGIDGLVVISEVKS
jgi:predicted nucleic acid-binding protein